MLTTLEKELMKKVMELEEKLEEKTEESDRYFRWWLETENKLKGTDKVSGEMDEILKGA